MGKSLFGSGGKSSSVSGFRNLTLNQKKQYEDLLGQTMGVVGSPEQYFSPMGLTQGENIVGGALMSPFTDPQAYTQNIEAFLNPYRDIVTSDINRQFEGAQGALASQISEAGAFGGSRARQAEGDLERARLDAISNALSGQYNTAQNQYMQGLQGLLGFGGLERGLDLQQRQALPQALEFGSSMFSPLLGGSSSKSVGPSEGIAGSLGGGLMGLGEIGGLEGLTAMFAMSDKRIKKNIKKIGKADNGLDIYYFEYKNSDAPQIGFMAQDVEKVMPEHVIEIDGYKAINLKAVANG